MLDSINLVMTLFDKICNCNFNLGNRFEILFVMTCMYNMHYIYALSYATTSSRTCCPGVTCDTSWLQSGICDNDLWPLLGAPSNTNTNFLDFKILSIDIVSTRNVKVRRNQLFQRDCFIGIVHSRTNSPKKRCNYVTSQISRKGGTSGTIR